MLHLIRYWRELVLAVLMLPLWALPVSGKEPAPVRFLVLSPHTDDAEFGVGGLLVRLVRQGHDVTIANMILNNDAQKAAALRTKQILGVQTVEWLGFKEVSETPETRTRMAAYLDSKRPEVIFAPWPVDEHPDHRGTGSLAVYYVNSRQQAYVDARGNVHPGEYCPQLFFFEALTGKQSKLFRPDVYVDLPADVVEAKKLAMNVYNTSAYMNSAVEHHVKMLCFRGLESGVNRQACIDRGVWAEAFVAFPLGAGQRRIELPGQK